MPRPPKPTPSNRAPVSDKYPRIYAVVARVPKGKVATYGQIAELAGLPRQARLVGYALHALPAEGALPWHRVVNARGAISLRGNGLGHDELQAQLLRHEGVQFEGDAIPLERYRWQPRLTSGRRSPASTPSRTRRPDTRRGA